MSDTLAADASVFNIRFNPAYPDLDQNEESFAFEHEGKTRRLRVHDYADIFAVPGLYEALVYDKLECSSPTRVAEIIQSVLIDWPHDPADLRVLDLGAGNGIMAEQLRSIGVEHIIGLDLLPEAGDAAQRDRPQVYDDYVVADLTELSATDRKRLKNAKFNALVTVAALGFGDIPPDAFAAAFNLVEDGGWIAMTIKEDFLSSTEDSSGFSKLVRWMIDEGILEIQAHHRYCHRLSIQGEQIFYIAVVARKTSNIPAAGDEKRIINNGAAAGSENPTSLLLQK